MNCTEVIEWMHRYLDHDLSQEEMIEMFRHIDDCPSCAEIFERLTLLSKQLEELPDVKPPFSIVDSIMPRLDELDRNAVQPENKPGADEENIVPIGSRSRRGQTVRKRSTIAGRTGIGAVAAAALLLIAIIKMPESLPSAETDSLLNSAANTGAANQGASEQYAESRSASDDTAKMYTFSGEVDPGDTGDSAENGAGSSSPDSGGQPADQAAPLDAAPSPTEVSARDEAPATSTPPAAAKQQPPSNAAGADKTAAPENGNVAADPAADTSAADAAGNAAAEAAAAEGQSAPVDTRIGTMGLLPALVAGDSVWSSPDGRVIAELAGQQINFYILTAATSSDQRTLLAAIPFTGSWVSGTWSEDSLHFTYVTEADGAETVLYYTVPEASPSAAAPSAGAGSAASPQATQSPGASAAPATPSANN